MARETHDLAEVESILDVEREIRELQLLAGSVLDRADALEKEDVREVMRDLVTREMEALARAR